MFNGKWFLSAFLGGVAALFLLLLGTATPSCLPTEGALPCMREWLGAASGYIAALGALAAARMTLPLLQEQAKQARMQTAFAVGDAEPTLDLFESLDAMMVSSFDLRIVNYNRSSLDITGITVDVKGPNERQFTASLDTMRASGGELGRRQLRRTERPFRDFVFRRPIYLHGWEDRSGAPEFLQVEVTVAQEGGDRQQRECDVIVTVHARQSRDGGRPITLVASGTFLVDRFLGEHFAFAEHVDN